jgi:hypothetical protein
MKKHIWQGIEVEYYDVTYISPTGVRGTHTAYRALNEDHARTSSPEMLALNTQFNPEDFTVIDVKPSENLPEELKQ